MARLKQIKLPVDLLTAEPASAQVDGFGWYRWFSTQDLNLKLQIISLVILAVTAVIIAWYTSETYRLRKLAQKQYRGSFNFKPVIALICRQDHPTGGVWRLALQEVLVRNVGNGPAFNVQVAPIKYREYVAEFEPFEVVAKDQAEPAHTSVLKNGQASGFSHMLSALEAMLVMMCRTEPVSSRGGSVFSSLRNNANYGTAWSVFSQFPISRLYVQVARSIAGVVSRNLWRMRLAVSASRGARMRILAYVQIHISGSNSSSRGDPEDFGLPVDLLRPEDPHTVQQNLFGSHSPVFAIFATAWAEGMTLPERT